MNGGADLSALNNDQKRACDIAIHPDLKVLLYPSSGMLLLIHSPASSTNLYS
jgi:hypothetical protein